MKFFAICFLLFAVVSPMVRAEGEDVQPAAEQPVAEQPVAEQPAAEQPTAEQPAAEQPAAEQPLVTELVASTTAPIVQPATESWEDFKNFEYTDFRMSIDHLVGNVLVQIVDWQASIFEHIIINLSPLLTQVNELKAKIRSAKATEESAIRSVDVAHSKSLLQQQVSLLKDALSTGNKIEQLLVNEQKSIENWIVEVNSNVEGARNRKLEISTALDSKINTARNEIKETKSHIQKIFQNHFYTIENDRLSMNGKLDKLALDFKATLAQLITTIQITNNSVSNRLTQEANSLQQTIDSTVSGLRHQLDSNLMAEDRDKIVNHLDERAQQLDENLFIGHFENQNAVDNYASSLIADINNNIWSLDNDLNTMKNQFGQLTTVNKARANRLSIQTYKTLEPVESLLSSLGKKLQRSVESVRV